jgi:hypothetical protein
MKPFGVSEETRNGSKPVMALYPAVSPAFGGPPRGADGFWDAFPRRPDRLGLPLPFGPRASLSLRSGTRSAAGAASVDASGEYSGT